MELNEFYVNIGLRRWRSGVGEGIIRPPAETRLKAHIIGNREEKKKASQQSERDKMKFCFVVNGFLLK
jgi:hypothetical protein